MRGCGVPGIDVDIPNAGFVLAGIPDGIRLGDADVDIATASTGAITGTRFAAVC